MDFQPGTAATSTKIQCVWKPAPILLSTTLTISVSVQREELGRIVKVVSL